MFRDQRLVTLQDLRAEALHHQQDGEGEGAGDCNFVDLTGQLVLLHLCRHARRIRGVCVRVGVQHRDGGYRCSRPQGRPWWQASTVQGRRAGSRIQRVKFRD